MSEPTGKTDLPSGGWVTFRDPTTITEKQRKPVKRIQIRVAYDKQVQAAVDGSGSAADLSDAQVDLLNDYVEAVTVCLIDGWSFEDAVSVDALQDRQVADYDAIITAAAPHRDALMPSGEPNPDPASPTEPSTGSSTD